MSGAADVPPHDLQSYPGHDLEVLADLDNYYQWILQDFLPHLRGDVLEIGAGTGAIASRYVHTAGIASATLLEPANEIFETLSGRFAGVRHVTTAHNDLDSWLVRNPTQRFDAAIMVNVLEHVRDDQGLLNQLFSILKPGGTLLLFVPALPWLFGSLDRAVRHERRYTTPVLRARVGSAGFEVLSHRYLDVAGVFPWWFMGKVVQMNRFDSVLARTYDRFVVPVMSRIEARVPPPFGKNISLVATRRDDRF